MTRYEFATMLFKAMAKGAVIHESLIDEFRFELGRIRVDLIKGEVNSEDSVERVRVNDDAERNQYGDRVLVAVEAVG